VQTSADPIQIDTVRYAGPGWADARAIRMAVFVAEQGVDEALELDEHEASARHFLARSAATGEALGTARWRPYTTGVKLERFAVLAAARGQGVGAALLQAVLADVAEQGATGPRVLHAQVSAKGFYEKFGFAAEGPEFDEAGIAHVKMVRAA
jgi:predicted GNAT family N-acyltransferase